MSKSRSKAAPKVKPAAAAKSNGKAKSPGKMARPKPPAEANGRPAAAPVTSPCTERQAYEAAVLLKQLSDATRLSILLILHSSGPTNVGDLCGVLSASQPAVSHHLALLRHGRVVEPVRSGKTNIYALTETGTRAVAALETLISTIKA